MGTIFEALNKPAEAFRKGNRRLSFSLVVLTILVDALGGALLGPLSIVKYKPPEAGHVLLVMLFGAASYAVFTAGLWLVCKCFGSRAGFTDYLNTWGLTFFPTLLCAVIVAVTEVFFYVFWNSVAWALVFNVVFGGILIWKTVLYVVYLKEVAGLSRGRLIGAMITGGVFILLLAMADAHLGLITPVI